MIYPGSSQHIPTGNFNEKILCERIRQETGNVGGKCNEIFRIVTDFCVDEDVDSFCNWGILKEKPDTCPSFCKDQIDLDDTDPDIIGLTGETCGDGTPVGSCAKFKPLKCVYDEQSDFFAEIDDCNTCGCPGNSLCNDDGNCYR